MPTAPQLLPLLLLLGLPFLAACRRADVAGRLPWPAVAVPTAPATNLRTSCVAGFDAGMDYFPEKTRVEYATQFSVSYHGNYKRLVFRPNVEREAKEEYLLVQCGTPAPPHDAGVRVVTVPAQRFMLANLSLVSAAVRMGLTDALVGVSSMNGVSQPEVVERHRQGRISEVGTGPHSSVELAMAAEAELLFTFYSAWPNYNTHPKLWEVGVQGLPTADHFEQSALGRSEWVKFLALFFNREREAEEIFAPAAARYEELRQLTAGVSERPEVLVGWPSGRDVWNLNGARNFFASLIADAGGRYFWNDQLALSLIPANLEQVFDEQRASTIYISRSFTAANRAALAAKNPMMPWLRAYSANRIWSPDKNTAIHRRPPWQDQSMDHPDVVLKDLIAALHPELLPTYEPYYLRKLD